MARSLAGSLIALVGVATLLGCSSDETGSGSTPTGPGSGGSAGNPTSSSSAGAHGGAGTGGVLIGGGGTGGVPTGGTGGVENGGGGIGGVATGGMGGMAGGGGFGGDPNNVDSDGDGWTPNDGDCCDIPGPNCAEPFLVNPGAFEYLGNQVDDDCDGNTLDNVPVPDCGGMPLQTPTSSAELVKALDLCQIALENPPTLKEKKWGVLASYLLLADGTSANPPKDVQVGALGKYGTNVLPKKGGTMASLSSGTARAEGDPNYKHPQNGTMAGQNTGNFNAMTQVSGPADYLAAHGDKFPSPPACPPCSGANCSTSYDSVDFKVRIRVPTNAKSFSYNLKFYSAEFPEFLCGQYNDFFLALLKSNIVTCPPPNVGDPCIPLDKNIAFDGAIPSNPVSVNNGFFEVCFPPPQLPGSCPAGTLELVGNGMGGWDGNLKDGGGTQWLTNDAPVVPGETIELEFIIWDAGDHNVDSLILLDNFRWKVTPSPVGTHT